MTWLVSVGIVLMLAFWILFFAFRDVPYSHRLWWDFAFDEGAPRALRATLAASMLAAGIACWQLLRPAAGRFVNPPTTIYFTQPASFACRNAATRRWL